MRQRIISIKAQVKNIATKFFSSLLIIFILLSLLGNNGAVFGFNQRLIELNNSFQTSDEEKFLKTYQEGRSLLAQQEWEKAAEKFNRLIKDYPNYKLLDAAFYWLAYAYKKQNELKETEALLRNLIKLYPASSWTDDAKAMLVEISGTAPKNKKEKTDTDKTAEENSEIKLAALRSLYLSSNKKGIEAAGEIIGKDSKASAPFKENVIRLMASYGGESAVPLLIEVFGRETDVRIRKAAVITLGVMNYDAGVDFLIRQYDLEKSLSIKVQIVNSLMYKDRSVSKLMEIARNGKEPFACRQVAITGTNYYAGEKGTDFLVQLYDAESSPEIKEIIIQSLGITKKKRGTKKLMDIALHDESAEMRKNAITALGGSNDPEVINFLKEIIK